MFYNTEALYGTLNPLPKLCIPEKEKERNVPPKMHNIKKNLTPLIEL
jgi:hypothetical protein